jgi:hypothetical protein
MLDWGEASPEEKKKFIRDYAIAAALILIGVIALTVF